MLNDARLKIVIDADACPRAALQISMSLGRKYSVPVWTVASFSHNIQSDNHITVGNDSQEVDLKVCNIASRGDVVVTQDWGLAAVILGKGARCLSPGGIEFRSSTIDFLLEEREMKAKIRRSGGRTKGPSKRTDSDDHRFRYTLDLILRESTACTQ